MKDKIRKLGAWLWRNKERIILAAMVITLCTQVYKVFQVQEVDTTFVPPPGNLTDIKVQDLEATNQLPPPNPPPPPKPYPYGSYATLVDRNPFFYHATQQAGGTDQGEQQWDVQVERVAEPVPGKRRAQVTHGTVTEWYDEGEGFAEYELQEVNVAEGTATIYSTRFRETREFQVP